MPPPRDLFTCTGANTACRKTCQHSRLLTPPNFCLLATKEMLWLNLPVRHISKPCTLHRVNCVVVTQPDKTVKVCAPSWAWGKGIRKDLAVQGVAEMSVWVLQTSRCLLNYTISPLTLQRVQGILSQCIANMCTAVTLPEISEQKIMLIRDENCVKVSAVGNSMRLKGRALQTFCRCRMLLQSWWLVSLAI